MKPKIFRTKAKKDKYLRKWGLTLQQRRGMTINAIYNRFKEKGYSLSYGKVKRLLESKENEKEILK
jgi:hypothetical protein